MKPFLGFLALLVLTGCASSTIYHWGHYEELLYSQFQKPGEATPEMQVLKLQEDIQVAKSKNKPLPPGFYAHLGYQYLQMGKTTEARQSFVAEKTQFPESAVLMDRFIRKLK